MRSWSSLRISSACGAVPQIASMPARLSSTSARRLRAGGTSKTLTPLRPARPVRPERCCMTSGSFGISAWMTRSRFGRSMPRAATSVATQTRARPSRSACSAWVRSFWVNSPDSATTEKPRSRQRRLQMPDRFARVAKHQRARRFEEAQGVDDRMVDIAGRDPDGAVIDVGMTALVAARPRYETLLADTLSPARR